MYDDNIRWTNAKVLQGPEEKRRSKSNFRAEKDCFEFNHKTILFLTPLCPFPPPWLSLPPYKNVVSFLFPPLFLLIVSFCGPFFLHSPPFFFFFQQVSSSLSRPRQVFGLVVLQFKQSSELCQPPI